VSIDFDFELDREQSLALGGLALLFLLCGAAATISIRAWSDSAEEAAQRRTILAQVEAAQRRSGPGGTHAAIAPEAAFLVAPTEGQASALLQAHVTRLVTARRASIASSATQPATRDDVPDVVRLRVMFDMELSALQATLYELETGAPYVFVDAFVVSPQHSAQHGAESTLLRITLDLRAFWRRAQI
jgi:general secretion pathway protein M